MLPESIHLEIVSPERLLFSGEVDAVTVPGEDGYLGILPGHAPLLSKLQIGEVTYRKGKSTSVLSCCWGFVEVLPDRVTVLTQVAERPEDIDRERAQLAKERAEKRLRSGNPDLDFERAQLALRRALLRLKVATQRSSR
jgi:F-type H+-transporting ATPase subunit epsilon